MLLVPSEGGDYSENEIKSYQSRDEYCHSASLSYCIGNQIVFYFPRRQDRNFYLSGYSVKKTHHHNKTPSLLYKE